MYPWYQLLILMVFCYSFLLLCFHVASMLLENTVSASNRRTHDRTSAAHGKVENGFSCASRRRPMRRAAYERPRPPPNGDELRRRAGENKRSQPRAKVFGIANLVGKLAGSPRDNGVPARNWMKRGTERSDRPPDLAIALFSPTSMAFGTPAQHSLATHGAASFFELSLKATRKGESK